MHLICSVNKVICRPVSADIVPFVKSPERGGETSLTEGDSHPSWEIRTKHNGDHREDNVCRVESFPKPGRLREVSDALWSTRVSTLGRIEVRGM